MNWLNRFRLWRSTKRERLYYHIGLGEGWENAAGRLLDQLETNGYITHEQKMELFRHYGI